MTCLIVDQRAAHLTPSNAFLEVQKNMKEVLLVLKVPLTQYSQVKNLFSCTESCITGILKFKAISVLSQL